MPKTTATRLVEAQIQSERCILLRHGKHTHTITQAMAT
jgi:hypothetical protein